MSRYHGWCAGRAGRSNPSPSESKLGLSPKQTAFHTLAALEHKLLAGNVSVSLIFRSSACVHSVWPRQVFST